MVSWDDLECRILCPVSPICPSLCWALLIVRTLQICRDVDTHGPCLRIADQIRLQTLYPHMALLIVGAGTFCQGWGQAQGVQAPSIEGGEEALGLWAPWMACGEAHGYSWWGRHVGHRGLLVAFSFCRCFDQREAAAGT